MSNLVPFLLREAVVSLFPAAGDGTAILGPAIWMGALATQAEITLQYEPMKLMGSGERYSTEHQLDQDFLIELERSWILRRSSPVDFRPARNQQYVLELVWTEDKPLPGYGRSWYQLTFFGVTPRAVRMPSQGTNQFVAHQSWRAQRCEDQGGVLPWGGGGGGGGTTVYTPFAPVLGVEQPVAWFRENPLIVGEYLLGTYRWAMAVRLGTARLVAWAPQASVTVLELEVDGSLTGNTLVIPIGTANTEVTATADLSAVTVNAGSVVRWKVISGPSVVDAAWVVSVTVGASPIGN